MSNFWHLLLGIERSPGAWAGGNTRLVLTALPRGAGGVALVLGAIVLIALVGRLYRREL